MSIIPPSTMITSNLTEQRPRKLRASCDACSRAKVKCDKVRPTCHRCGNMGICCNYSPSMRLGKPRKNRNPDGTIQRDVSPASSCGPLGPRPDMIPRTTSSTSTASSPEPMDPYFYGPSTPEYHYQDAFMAASFDGSHSPYSDTGSFVSGWSNDDQLMFQQPSEALFTSMPQFPPPSSYAGHVRSSSVQSHPDVFSPMDSLTHSPPLSSPQYFGMAEQQSLPIFSPEKIASPPPMVPAPLPTPPTSATAQNHDCTQFAFSTLNSLYSPPSSQPSAGDFNGASNGLPTLDTVLATNKTAIDKVFVLLGCSCSANPHFSTTIAFTIIKILSWYQAVAGMNHIPTESPINTQIEAFTHAPISLGDFRLEGENEETIRTQLVLSELRKVEKLIDKFSERYCKSANPAENGIDGGVYTALESMLRTRVRDTFKVTMKAAPEEVKRRIASRAQQRPRHNTIS
ncbi:Zn-II 2Cys6 regulatory protein [Zopfia rhizophila CBS 207.26]|uniref:Zn-II 2Cys6 regulatory protein n=1 Tax=Zopfia rhizophila CBS 207.26 TaxID=1314779 RepID=A0A6A6DT17_9PEZI|nr:Zn-II 2Cys6 regulatory protein [Zopfia rhizophila CBS 207.26]